MKPFLQRRYLPCKCFKVKIYYYSFTILFIIKHNLLIYISPTVHNTLIISPVSEIVVNSNCSSLNFCLCFLIPSIRQFLYILYVMSTIFEYLKQTLECIFPYIMVIFLVTYGPCQYIIVNVIVLFGMCDTER
jgi:hypothetical protein